MGFGIFKEQMHQLEVESPGGNPVTLLYTDLGEPGPGIAEALRSTTTPEEHARADRFVKDLHGHRFLAARSFLRHVLAEALGMAPLEIRFSYNPHEKPLLAGNPIHFNLSHSGNVAAVGLTQAGELGIDIETRSSLKTARQVSPRVMTPAELNWWQALPEDGQMDAFIRLWTLKEAILKAQGEGLLRDAREIRLDLDKEEPGIASLSEPLGPLANWEIGLADAEAGFPRIAWALRS